MYGDGICQLQLLQLLKAVLHHPPLVKFHLQGLGKGVYLAYDAHVAVEDALALVHRDPIAVPHLPGQLVIIFDLHYLIPGPEYGTSRLLFRLVCRRRIEIFLEDPVQLLHAQSALAHGRHDLDLLDLRAHIARQLIP